MFYSFNYESIGAKILRAGVTQDSPGKRRGRPPAKDSEDTRRSIIDAARRNFAQVGFQGSSLSGIARENELTTTALYHYFDDKESLYDAVTRETIEFVWSGLHDRVRDANRLARQVEEFLTGADQFSADERLLSAFLVGVPVEAGRDPRFVPLLELLSEWQTRVFDEMAATGAATGELGNFVDRDAASQALRMLLLGWSYETHYRPQYRKTRADAVRIAVAAWQTIEAPRSKNAQGSDAGST